jgi:hypothetical protein
MMISKLQDRAKATTRRALVDRKNFVDAIRPHRFRERPPRHRGHRAPPAWKEIAGYLVGRRFTRKPSPPLAEQAMAQMLQAIRTAKCRADEAIEPALAGSDLRPAADQLLGAGAAVTGPLQK